MQDQTFRIDAARGPVRLTLSLFLLLVAAGYGMALAEIATRHADADGRPGLTLDDLRAHYHGIEVGPGDSEMLHEVRPDGGMRSYLEEGGETEVNVLVSWLERGGREEDFSTGSPSPSNVIRDRCTECHNPETGEKDDLPYAPEEGAEPVYHWVAEVAVPLVGPGGKPLRKGPVNADMLVHVAHIHILSMPVFALLVGLMFLFTGASPKLKAFLGPAPLLFLVLDFAAWWLARWAEPFVYLIALAGALFGLSLGAQILLVLRSMWFPRKG